MTSLQRSPSSLALATLLVLACSALPFADAEEERVVQALGLAPGMRVADVGAGSGRWSVALARAVGPTGRVYATEVDRDEIEQIEKRARRAELRNVEVLLGDQQSTGLPEGCCDAVLLRLVYHHFTDPPTMRAALWQALEPGGTVVVVETAPQRGWRRLDDVPERGGHGIPRGELEHEMLASGFEIVERIDPWPGGEGDPYCLVFRKPE